MDFYLFEICNKSCVFNVLLNIKVIKISYKGTSTTNAMVQDAQP